MSTIRAIQLALEVAEQRRTDAQAIVFQNQRASQFALSQMDQLQTYASDKDARWVEVASVGAAPVLMLHHYQFVDRLRHAIGLQHGVIGETDKKLAHSQRGLIAADVRVLGLKHLLDKQKRKLDAIRAGKEQKATDEFAAFQFSRAVAGQSMGERA